MSRDRSDDKCSKTASRALRCHHFDLASENNKRMEIGKHFGLLNNSNGICDNLTQIRAKVLHWMKLNVMATHTFLSHLTYNWPETRINTSIVHESHILKCDGRTR